VAKVHVQALYRALVSGEALKYMLASDKKETQKDIKEILKINAAETRKAEKFVKQLQKYYADMLKRIGKALKHPEMSEQLFSVSPFFPMNPVFELLKAYPNDAELDKEDLDTLVSRAKLRILRYILEDFYQEIKSAELRTSTWKN